MPEANTVIVAVFGAHQCSAEVYQAARLVGQGIARAGAILVCGGTTGVMEAACRGAKEAGGLTVGILPGDSREQANPYVDIPIVTGLGDARNVIIARSCHAAIAISGGYGTLSEIAFALKFGLPAVGLGTWSLAREGIKVPLVPASSPHDAVEKALAAARGNARRWPPPAVAGGPDSAAASPPGACCLN
ncbi:MAG: TIGR00725 family protein [Bacillota bacterium]